MRKSRTQSNLSDSERQIPGFCRVALHPAVSAVLFAVLFCSDLIGQDRSTSASASISASSANHRLRPFVINEVCAINTGHILDEGGRAIDWIEIFNPNPHPLDIAGYYLSDSPRRPRKHQIPLGSADTIISARGFLLLWASGTTHEGPLHLSFRLSSNGETVTLTAPDGGTTVDSVTFEECRADMSYGRAKDGALTWGHFSPPSPAASNNSGFAYSQLLSPPTFSHSGGFYTTPFPLAIISPDPKAAIYYTVDGSDPDPNNLEGRTFEYKNSYQQEPDQPEGSFLQERYQSYRYNGPIHIKSREAEPNRLSGKSSTYEASPSSYMPDAPIFKGTPVRAMAVKPGAAPSRIVNATFFVHPDGAQRYPLPIVAITVPERNLFGFEDGIYCAGKAFDEWRKAHPSESARGDGPANWQERGVASEVMAGFEFFENGKSVVQQNIGIRVQGQWSRGSPRKSLRLYSRARYDEKDSFDYPLFGELRSRGSSDTPVKSFSRLILRNSGTDHHAGSLYRDALMQALIAPWSVDVQAAIPVIHFINGEFWGLMNLRERPDHHYIANHYRVDPDDVAILTGDAEIKAGTDADQQHFQSIIDYVESNDPADADTFAWIEERMDIENLISYFAAQIYYDNTDWPHNNVILWRLRPGAPDSDERRGHDGRWRWVLYDTDYGFDMFNQGSGNQNIYSVIHGKARPSTLFRRLLRNPNFQNAFINKLLDGLNSCFHPDRVLEMIQHFHTSLATVRIEHIARWKSGSYDVEVLRRFATERPNHVLNQLKTQFKLDPTAQVTIAPPEGGRGRIQINSLIIDSELTGHPHPATPYPWTGTYFQNIPITLTAHPDEGYRFIRWSGIEGPDATEPVVTLSLQPTQTVTAQFER